MEDDNVDLDNEYQEEENEQQGEEYIKKLNPIKKKNSKI